MRSNVKRCFFFGVYLAFGGCGNLDDGYDQSDLHADDNAEAMFLAIGAKSAQAFDQHLYVSTSRLTESVSFCVDQGTSCAAGTTMLAEKHRETADRYIFRSVEAYAIADGMQLRFEAEKTGVTVEPFIVKLTKAGVANPVPDTSGSAGEPVSTDDYNWRNDITWIDVPSYPFNGNTYGSAYYKDVMTHTKSPYLKDGPLTSVHESLHFMLHENAVSGNKFIYYRDGKGALLPEAATKTSTIEPYIPRSIVSQAKLYDTYIKSRPGQVLGENIFDEWKAYIVESHVLIESTKAGTPVPNDSVEGASTEFLYYCAAAIHALSENEPDYLQKASFKAIFAMLAEESRFIIDNLIAILLHTRTKAQFDHLQSHAESEGIRKSIRALYGETWTMRVLGF